MKEIFNFTRINIYATANYHIINAISNAITRNNLASLTSMDMLLALKDAIEDLHDKAA